MSQRRINPPELPAASGFSHAVTASGTLVLLAGQTGQAADGTIVPGGVVVQFEQALTNVLTALAAAGCRPGHLASLTVYAVDLADYRSHARDLGRIWRRLVGTEYPAMAAVGVSRLWDDEAVVELQGVAVRPLV